MNRLEGHAVECATGRRICRPRRGARFVFTAVIALGGWGTRRSRDWGQADWPAHSRSRRGSHRGPSAWRNGRASRSGSRRRCGRGGRSGPGARPWASAGRRCCWCCRFGGRGGEVVGHHEKDVVLVRRCQGAEKPGHQQPQPPTGDDAAGLRTKVADEPPNAMWEGNSFHQWTIGNSASRLKSSRRIHPKWAGRVPLALLIGHEPGAATSLSPLLGGA